MHSGVHGLQQPHTQKWLLLCPIRYASLPQLLMAGFDLDSDLDRVTMRGQVPDDLVRVYEK